MDIKRKGFQLRDVWEEEIWEDRTKQRLFWKQLSKEEDLIWSMMKQVTMVTQGKLYKSNLTLETFISASHTPTYDNDTNIYLHIIFLYIYSHKACPWSPEMVVFQTAGYEGGLPLTKYLQVCHNVVAPQLQVPWSVAFLSDLKHNGKLLSEIVLR